MPHKLLIRLKNTATEKYSIDWVLLDSNGDVIKVASKNGVNELASIARSAQQIIVLVPGEDILLTSVRLPKLSSARLAKAIPYALEDQITEESSALHFAVGRAKAGDLLPVAVVNKDKMLAWQSFITNILKETYSQVKVFLPDVLALPWQADTLHILIDQNLALVRTGISSGFVIEREELFQILQLILKKPNQTKPGLIHIDAPEAMTVFTEKQIAQLGVPVQMSKMPVHPLSMSAKSLSEPYPINLLQGVFLPAFKKVTLNQLIGSAFVIAGAWFVVLTLANIASYIILQRERSALDNEMHIIYNLVYPTSSLPPNPKAILQKELGNLQASHADSAFIRLINIIGPDITPLVQAGVTVKEIIFRDNQLILEIEAKDLSLLDKLRQSLELQGLKAVVSNAERGTGGLVETRLTVEEMP